MENLRVLQRSFDNALESLMRTKLRRLNSANVKGNQKLFGRTSIRYLSILFLSKPFLQCLNFVIFQLGRVSHLVVLMHSFLQPRFQASYLFLLLLNQPGECICLGSNFF